MKVEAELMGVVFVGVLPERQLFSLHFVGEHTLGVHQTIQVGEISTQQCCNKQIYQKERDGHRWTYGDDQMIVEVLELKTILFYLQQFVVNNLNHMEQSESTVLLPFNHIMEYDWGSPDPHCLIAQLRKEQHPKYAELWMGTHPKGPSKVDQKQTLADYLHGQALPFLFKVLCIQKALSIQLHPNKQQAQELFKSKPNIYADDNQKPEMFYTLTDFECLFGIISEEDLVKLMTIEPFSRLKCKDGNNIKGIIAQILSLSEEERKKGIQEAIKNIASIFPERAALLQRLQEQFPWDQGILVSCLLRYKVLQPGKCFAIAAGVPHAYLRGTCLQIMKNSDNVVRLGLTPKLKDVETMLKIMKDQVGLDGLEVERTEHGYIWNDLVLNPQELKGEVKEIEIRQQSIGIVAEGQLTIEGASLKAGKGDVFYIRAGKYKAKGSALVYFGGFQSH